MKKGKKENYYLCFRYKCKRCPKERECEKEQTNQMKKAQKVL